MSQSNLKTREINDKHAYNMRKMLRVSKKAEVDHRLLTPSYS